MTDKVLHRPEDLDPLAGSIPSIDPMLSRRVNADPENLERGPRFTFTLPLAPEQVAAR